MCMYEMWLGPSIINRSTERRAPQYHPRTQTPNVGRPTHTFPQTQTQPPAEAHEAFEQTLCQVRTVHVFKIPPRVTSGGHRAGDWKDEVRWVYVWLGGGQLSGNKVLMSVVLCACMYV